MHSPPLTPEEPRRESRSYPSYTHAPLKRFYSSPPFLQPSSSPPHPAITPGLTQLIVSEGVECRTLFEISSCVSRRIIRDNLNLRHLPREFTPMPTGRSRAKRFYLSALDPPRLPDLPACLHACLYGLPVRPAYLPGRERFAHSSIPSRLLFAFSTRNLFWRGVTSKWTNPLCNQNEKQQSAQTVALIPRTHRKPIHGFLHDVI